MRKTRIKNCGCSRTPYTQLLGAAMVMVLPVGSIAQVLSDPTRPPAGIYANEGGDAAATGPVLQSVMITPGARTAIIGGETVKLGGQYGDARVVKITENEVVLRSAAGTETLRMYPDVTMKTSKPAPAVRGKPAQKKRRPAASTREKQG
jgi:MSHA biogenesis protein MshK